jgi:hypothetical protein
MLLAIRRQRIHKLVTRAKSRTLSHRHKFLEKKSSHQGANAIDRIFAADLHQLIKVLGELLSSYLFVDEIVSVQLC